MIVHIMFGTVAMQTFGCHGDDALMCDTRPSVVLITESYTFPAYFSAQPHYV